ncbi:hypothetical protein RJ55_05539 [Drechmeria coniospora]|nr:hypothetical protein RJ55_05539 [Drechmeria coniospora]
MGIAQVIHVVPDVSVHVPPSAAVQAGRYCSGDFRPITSPYVTTSTASRQPGESHRTRAFRTTPSRRIHGESALPGRGGLCRVSSRGKHAGESASSARLHEVRTAKGEARLSDESETDDDIEPGWSPYCGPNSCRYGIMELNFPVGAVVLHRLFDRRVIRYPDNTVVKSGKRMAIGEADALRVAARARRIPGPSCLRGVQVVGWPESETNELHPRATPRSTSAHHDGGRNEGDCPAGSRRGGKMRSVAPPPHLIGACDGTEIRDTRLHCTYSSPPCRDEKTFNEFLLSSLFDQIPPPLREAFSRGMRTNHRICLSHGDLALRNILLQEGRIVGLVDWEDGGWYPEYWSMSSSSSAVVPGTGNMTHGIFSPSCTVTNWCGAVPYRSGKSPRKVQARPRLPAIDIIHNCGARWIVIQYYFILREQTSHAKTL